MVKKDSKKTGSPDGSYQLEAQIGYKLRLANQRHLEIFSRLITDFTPTQFSVLVRLNDVGAVSQNQLGRLVGMDAATTKGVVNRLVDKGLVKTRPDGADMRRLVISLTDEGVAALAKTVPIAHRITSETTAKLTRREAARLCALLDKL
jgi:DNA-binding MarR family transcriptional regulator